MLTDLQKKTAQAIINIFETGKVQGDYSNVTFVPSDRGGLTYGRSQTTLMSGNLFKLIKAYCNAENANFATELRPYLSQLEAKDRSLNTNSNLRNLLQKAGQDSVMQHTQDTFFDENYWNPSVQYANSMGIQSPLGMAVVYDSVVHGSWKEMRDRTIQNFGTATNIGEQNWIKHYIDTRRSWLARQDELLRKTVYRMDAFKDLIVDRNWDLTLPLTVRGLRIDEESLTQKSSGRRLLRLQEPFMQGEDVRQLQEALTKASYLVNLDGVFGPATNKAVRQFQQDKNLTVDGVVGMQTLTALGLNSHQ